MLHYRFSPIRVLNRRLTFPGAVVGLVTFAYIGFGAFVGGGYDPGRDVAIGWAIVHAGARPLEGPLFAGHAHLGPIWFYLLALPLAFSSLWIGAALTVMVIGALQFPLAYANGKLLGDRRLGLIWVAALAMPGWSSFESVGFASTNVVRSCVLAMVYAVLRARASRKPVWWFLAGLAAAVATHAHPSCLWTFGFAACYAVGRSGTAGKTRREGIIALATISIGFVLPFLPALASASSIAASARVAEANISLVNLLRAPAIVWSIAWQGPHAIFRALYPPGDTLPRAIATAAALFGLGGAACGSIAAWRGDLGARWGLSLGLTAILFVAWVRPVTPVYMTYSIVPGFALLVASGWYACLLRYAYLVRVGVVGAFAASLTVGIGVVHAMREGGGRIDGAAINDVIHGPSRMLVANDVWLYAASVDAIGRALCANPSPVYGALAYSLDVFYAMPIRLHCDPEWRHFVEKVSNAGEEKGHMGLALRLYQDLGIYPAVHVGGLGIDVVTQVIAAPVYRDLPHGVIYPPHNYEFGLPTNIHYAFDAGAGEWLVISNPRVTWMPEWTTAVRCNGHPIAAATEDLVTRVYRCSTATRNHWEVTLAAAKPELLEIVTFTPDTRERRLH